MSFFKRKEQELRRTLSGECKKVYDETFAAVDKTLADKRLARETAKKLQESVAEVGARLHLKKA
jgi:hypothetical protein